MLRRLRRNTKGGPLIEFAFSALLLIVVLLAVMEFGIEMFARNVTERLTNRAAQGYALTRELDTIDEVFQNRADAITRRCLQEPEIILFDSISGQNPLFASGRVADGTASDDSAVMFRLSVKCEWPRITPALGGLLGATQGYDSIVVSRFLDGGS